MMRRALYTIPLLFLAVLILTSAGHAQTAGGNENVLVIAVSKVDVPVKLPGQCQVSGAVSEVLSGKGFRKGQAMVLSVPCGAHDQPLNPKSMAMLADPQVLKASKTGVAHVSDTGAPAWKETAASYRGMGPVSGYRVYDGVLQPLKQAAR